MSGRNNFPSVSCWSVGYTTWTSEQHKVLCGQYFLASAPSPHRDSPPCEEAPFEMAGLWENTQLHLIIRGQSQCPLFDVWKENSYAEHLISGNCCCLYKCLSFPQSAKCVSSWNTDLFISPQPHGDFSESLQRSSGCQPLWLGLCSSVT